jgi:cob(I)alamin adenosyltransferase
VQFTDTHSADPTLTTGLSVVLAGHIVNLRDRINAILTAHSQAIIAWGETLSTQMTAIKASHVNELRNAISTLYAALGLPAPSVHPSGGLGNPLA